MSEKEVLGVLGTLLHEGLSPEEVLRQRAQFGANVLETSRRKSAWKIFGAQFGDLFVLVLLSAALVAVFMGEPQDTIAILAIVLLNGLLGFAQEYRAEKAMEALRSLAAPHALVRRVGRVLSIPACDLVQGDLVLLEAGSLVPADVRLIESAGLEVNESTLTGESAPVEKSSRALVDPDLRVADQRNMVFKGTLVSAGRGAGVVVRSGMKTELGKVAKLLRQEVEVVTPLQRKLARFSKQVALLAAGLCGVIFAVGLLRGEAPGLIFLTAVSLAVAAIPEALPAVVSVTLALGARVMSRKNALVRKLSAVEALGSVTVIASDKTGTLTENRMSVQAIRPVKGGAREMLIRMLALSNDASVGESGVLVGEATETALLEAAMGEGVRKSELERDFPRIGEIPFSSERGMMTTVHRAERGALVFTKGAPERVLSRCTRAWEGDFHRGRVEKEASELAGQGYRVLAFAGARLSDIPFGSNLISVEQDLRYVGLAGLLDPPRKEAAESIRRCFEAGIRPLMITGDHPATAHAIARKLGLLTRARSGVVSGAQLSQMSNRELQERIQEVAVFARVAPEEKIRIVKVLQSAGEIVAMTGDGVNDAPALKRADIGVAMGHSGTDVSREASDLILLDDNFATIVTAVSEGRRVYDNIRKFVRFALSGNSGELWALFLAPFFGLPTPLVPIQILWINLVTDGLPGLAIGFERAERDGMKRPPRDPDESIFGRGLWQQSLWVGLLIGALTMGTQAWAYRVGNPHWQSMAFTVLALTQMGHVLAIRSERQSLFAIGIGSNPFLLGSVLLTVFLQLLALYLPKLREILKTAPLSRPELLLCLVISSMVLVAIEMEKWIRSRTRRWPA